MKFKINDAVFIVQRTLTKFHFQISQPNFVQFELYPLRVSCWLLPTRGKLYRDSKYRSKFCSLQKMAFNVPSNGLIQALLGSVVLTI